VRIQFATLGTSPEVVLNALRHVPMDELHLFTDNLDAVEVVEIEKFFTNPPLKIKVNSHVVDKFDLMNCILVMIRTIKNVKKDITGNDFEITLNMTGGTKIMTSAMLLVGYMVGARVFYLKKLRDDIGIGELIWIPMPSVSANNLNNIQVELLVALSKVNKPISLTNLKNMTSPKSLQAMRRYIDFFEDNLLIQSTNKGKERLIELTNSGKILVALMDK